jgi:hypothetical protein
VRCGFDTPEGFRQALAEWRSAIRGVYEIVFDVKARTGKAK